MSDAPLCPFLSPWESRMPPVFPAAALDEQSPPPPDKLTRRSPTLAASHLDPNDLSAQRWGIVAPAGEAGDALLGALQALTRHRGEEQGATPRVYRRERVMTPAEARRWVREVFLDEAVPTAERPRYLLLLGDLDTAVDDTLQAILQHEAYVGRLPFSASAAIESYAARLIAAEARPVQSNSASLSRRAFLVADGTPATDDARSALAAPLVADGFEVCDGLSGEAGRQAFVDTGRSGGLLFSVSHGFGRPSDDAGISPREVQGGLDFGRGAGLLAADLPAGPFLPDGFWFLFACFGAGTPRESAYHRWLGQIASTQRIRRDVDAVLSALPRPGEAPFTAALPALALARDDGPLGVCGHLDLAWSTGYRDVDNTPRARRVLDVFAALAAGARQGVALDVMHHAFRQKNDDLAAEYEYGPEAPEGRAKAARARLWMARNDLRGYVLLGDPAARIQGALAALSSK